ncbi:TPA: glycosyltransferase [Klebsiella pneumoniae]|uniref:glycosyltransferase n=1 Tax=Klebsiella pneumoniae TaxID=573 RepID=UPI000C79E1E5|nr:glycosyltransferase [Klebsiella pneumoniae]EIX9107027.1 glycosyltransferase [Klebsiella pneumoniae]EKJ7635790.1 glycosyltransferase [Klebsiella pneumoniae]MCQ0531491.1 glycosyltransferase [Klebsiella pneumoniae]MCQ0675290.1 glycosyltransferase [Klebsiella pneumoniae]MDZ1951247.1 glycosyltransferase [Klebsiella pneumoniae]
MTPDVSIIIPAYNAEVTIGGLLDCILRETRVALEVIVVNDGSTDATSRIVQGYRHDSRLTLLEQPNRGVYAARNAALAVHRGEWVIFLDADDTLADGFVYNRWRTAVEAQADVVLFNAWRGADGGPRRPVHHKQSCGRQLSGHAWIRHCVSHREWPHYLWLQITRSAYLREHGLTFHAGKSHKDILWTVQLAVNNGRFYVSDEKDYTWRTNPASITHRVDYYDYRARDYIDVITELHRLASLPENHPIRVHLLRHALVEARHFLGLYRRRIQDRTGVKDEFRARIALQLLRKGIHSASDVCFFIKLAAKLR